MTSQYEPKTLEEKWVKHWHESGVGIGDPASTKPKFSMVMPPPNVTGTLHLGHTMMAAVEDTLVRFKKMTGHEICWVPGIDHAGIATQSVVERHLARQNISKYDLGREEFLKKIWEWKEEKGDRILYQLRRLGCACDWPKQAFTMDPNLNLAVKEAFVTLHERGLIYRDMRLVSWSAALKTAISDIEVDSLEIEKPDRIKVPGFDKTVEIGMLWQFKYPLKNEGLKIHYPCASGSQVCPDPLAHTCGVPKIECTEWIEVATTRPETLFGDVGVAVNPNDERYKHMIGKELYHPFAPARRLVVVADNHCDPEFGTGAVKITPAHDKNDYEIGLRHKLTPITILNLDGTINEHGGPVFNGMHRFQARVVIEKTLTEMGLFVEKLKNTKKMTIPLCSRSGDIIEPMLLPQWYVNCDRMASRALKACQDGELRILPQGSEKQWYHWLSNNKDWCVSRQLWWGHRIPAYKIEHPKCKDEWVIARNEDEAKEKARRLLKEKFGSDETEKFELHQDPDVLDTWFSSGLFPFSVFGWPRKEPSADFRKFFPTTLLETGSDILFFWVARMVMLSLELLDVLPFTEVYLHPMVRDAHGKKMSKSTGNVVDPIDVINGISLDALNKAIESSNLKESERKRALDAQKKDFPNGIEECGTDALRFGLLAYLRGGDSVNLDINRVVAYRHFCNKIFNATKFVINSIEPMRAHLTPDRSESAHWADVWVRTKLAKCADDARKALTEYDFGAAVEASYGFFISDFCDVYLEMTKSRLRSPGSADSIDCASTLLSTLEEILKILHPLMPFITDECYTLLAPRSDFKSLMCLEFPKIVVSNPDDAAAIARDVTNMFNSVKCIRSMLAQFEVQPKFKLAAYIQSTSISQDKLEVISSLAKCGEVKLVATADNPTWVRDTTANGDIVALDPAGQIDFAKVIRKLEKKKAIAEKQFEALTTKMKIPNYSEKVPADIRAKNQESLDATIEELDRLQACLESAKSMC